MQTATAPSKTAFPLQTSLHLAYIMAMTCEAGMRFIAL